MSVDRGVSVHAAALMWCMQLSVDCKSDAYLDCRELVDVR
jgi:hypothetical protein